MRSAIKEFVLLALSTMSFLLKPVLSPALTGALFYVLTSAPPTIKDPVVNLLRQYLTPENITRTVTTLQWLFTFNLVRTANTFLSELSQNHWRWKSEKSKYDWPNEIIVITGAASGFGRLLAIDFARHGLKVMALDLGAELPKDMQSNSRIHYYQCDVTDSDKVNEVASRIKSEHGDPSILINNAGIGKGARIVDCKPKDIQAIFAVNIMSHYYTCAAFVPSMIKNRKGHVVTIASMASFLSASPIVPYANTKVAALSFHEGLTLELKHEAPEVKTTCVHPTWAFTGIIKGNEHNIKKSGMAILDPQIIVDQIVAQVLSGRGKQLIISPGTEWLSTLRAWPHWMSGLLIGGAGKIQDVKDVAKEEARKG